VLVIEIFISEKQLAFSLPFPKKHLTFTFTVLVIKFCQLAVGVPVIMSHGVRKNVFEAMYFFVFALGYRCVMSRVTSPSRVSTLRR